MDMIPNILGVARNIGESIKGIVIDENWGKIIREMDISMGVDEKEAVQITIIELSY